MNKIKIYLSVILFLSVFIPNRIANAQTCGFGCLGLSGVYGGYSYQKINSEGLISYISDHLMYGEMALPSITEFKDAKGFRVGANLIRFNYKGLIVTVKGFYQFLESKQSYLFPNSEPGNNLNSTLKLDYYGVGADVGYSLSSFISIKFIDAQVTFHSAKLSIKSNYNEVQSESEFKSAKSFAGYFIGSGLIFNLIKDYISVEVTAGYTNFKIDNLEDDAGNKISYVSNSNRFIKSGGLTLIGQINIGIPLY